MRYRRREAETTLRSLMGQFKVMLITGARQVGKTTMLQHVLRLDDNIPSANEKSFIYRQPYKSNLAITN